MRRRTVLLAFGVLIFDMRPSRAAGRPAVFRSLQTETGVAAARVVQNSCRLEGMTEVTRLCRLLSDRCAKNRQPVSPAFLQATLDACTRASRHQQLSGPQNDGFLDSLAQFRSLADRLVVVLAA